MPKFLFFALLSGGLLFLVDFNAKKALNEDADVSHQIRDSRELDS
jgi:hypothetical protein